MGITAIVTLAFGFVALIALSRMGGGDYASQLRAAPGDGTSVEALMAAGRKIEAIKRYREEHGVGLKEAKQAVEAMQIRRLH